MCYFERSNKLLPRSLLHNSYHVIDRFSVWPIFAVLIPGVSIDQATSTRLTYGIFLEGMFLGGQIRPELIEDVTHFWWCSGGPD